ncbi:MAG: TetR/AcrR family transcriptional regulator C-terminal domain-containing protein [Abitibacteriaceae bacterium]|nr:TetR/AcrR family transcriptional regulator C-terminal domain-containing protein [Abditibacteriaceae bacterium]
MPLRKEEDYEAKRQQIIDGALEVFASLGYEKASNKAIAQAAGIGSPGLIYHYFQDKEHLYREVLEQRLTVLQLLAHPQELEGLPPNEALSRLGRAFLQMLDAPQSRSLLRLMFSDAARDPLVAGLFWQTGPVRGLGFLEQYLANTMQAGQLRQVNPTFAAMQFMGPLVMYLLARTVFETSSLATIDREAMLEQHIMLFLEAMRPTAP